MQREQISYKQWLEKAKNKCKIKDNQDKELEKDFGGSRYAVPLILLEFETKKSKALLRAYDDCLLSFDEEENVDSYLERYLNNEPLAYIFGMKEFYGRDFIVSPATLIPRPESELIIDSVKEYYKNKEEEIKFCDIGTGTGCLALSLLAEIPKSSCVLYDLSSEALEIAKENAKKLALSERCTFILEDIQSAQSIEFFDCIVSNPPYIPRNEYLSLDKNVKEYEPQMALTSGETGYEIIEAVLAFAHNYLKNNGLLLIEHGYNQSEKVCEIALRYEGFRVESIKDYSGHLRICKIIKE